MNESSTDSMPAEELRESIAAQLRVVTDALSSDLPDRWGQVDLEFSLDSATGLSLDGRHLDLSGEAIQEQLLPFELIDEMVQLIELLQLTEKDSVLLGGTLSLNKSTGVTIGLNWV